MGEASRRSGWRQGAAALAAASPLPVQALNLPGMLQAPNSASHQLLLCRFCGRLLLLLLLLLLGAVIHRCVIQQLTPVGT